MLLHVTCLICNFQHLSQAKVSCGRQFMSAEFPLLLHSVVLPVPVDMQPCRWGHAKGSCGWVCLQGHCWQALRACMRCAAVITNLTGAETARNVASAKADGNVPAKGETQMRLVEAAAAMGASEKCKSEVGPERGLQSMAGCAICKYMVQPTYQVWGALHYNMIGTIVIVQAWCCATESQSAGQLFHLRTHACTHYEIWEYCPTVAS